MSTTESDNMDIDPTPFGSASSPEHTLATSPSAFPSVVKSREEHSTLSRMQMLNEELNERSRTEGWASCMTHKSILKLLLASVLVSVTNSDLLGTINQGDRFILKQSWQQAQKIVQNFSDKDLENWKLALQEGLDKGNWESLLDQGTSHLNCIAV